VADARPLETSAVPQRRSPPSQRRLGIVVGDRGRQRNNQCQRGGRRMDDEAPVLELVGITKHYRGTPPVRALDGIDLSVRAGEFVAIVGPSGPGKSTLINVVGGLHRPTSGTVRIDGRDVSRLSDARLAAVRGRRIGFVFPSGDGRGAAQPAARPRRRRPRRRWRRHHQRDGHLRAGAAGRDRCAASDGRQALAHRWAVPHRGDDAGDDRRRQRRRARG
jgi:ABC transporter